jgi:hypothetical protein
MSEEQFRRLLFQDLHKKFAFLADVHVEAGKDQTGDRALWVWLILKDRALAKNNRSAIDKLEKAARERVWSKDAELWPYIRIRTVSEQSEIDSATGIS